MTMYGPVGIQGPYAPPDAEEAALLRALGWTRISGEGPAAIWERPEEEIDGVVYPAERKPAMAILQDELGADSPYSNTNLKAAAADRAPARIGSGREYDAEGRAYFNGIPTPQFDNPTKAAGYRAPSAPSAGRAPTPPQTFTDRNGDVVGIDPFTGGEVYRIAGAQWADISPQEKEAIRQGDLARARQYATEDRAEERAYNRGVRAEDRAFTAGENAASRAQSATENALDRAIRAQDLAASISFRNQQLAMTAEENYQNRLQGYTNQKLDAANRFASLISATDPGALPAFLAAGGGNISNAIKRGATAQTDMANLGAARTLRASTEMEAPTRYMPDAGVMPGRDSEFPEYSSQQVSEFVNVNPNWRTQARAGAGLARTVNMGGQAASSQPVEQTMTAMSATTDPRSMANRRMDDPANPVPSFVKRYAGGTGTMPGADPFASPFGMPGQPATGEFITGDSMDPMDPAAGGARPELIQLEDPPGPDNAQAHITPLATGPQDRAAALFSAIGDFLRGATDQPPMMPAPRFAFGTGTFGADVVQEGDQPYLDRVRDIRTTTQYQELNPFDTRFAFEKPSVRNRFYAGRQLRYGTPIEDQQAETAEYSLSGFNGRALSQRV